MVNRQNDSFERRIFEYVFKIENKAKWLEVWQHPFASSKPLFRCISIEKLKIDIDLALI